MKTTHLLKGLSIGALFSLGTTLAMAVMPGSDMPLPTLFTSASKMVQNRICGEMLIGLALSGERGLTGEQTEDQIKRRDMSFNMAAEAGLFFSRSTELSAEEKAESKTTTRRLEELSPAVHISVVSHCTFTVDKWLKEGGINPTEAAQALEAVNMLIVDAQQRHDALKNIAADKI